MLKYIEENPETIIGIVIVVALLLTVIIGILKR